ncbi:hypothetical protein DPMN_093842 [Dreissena polymorpha]|uniref:Endonuclease n=1 Tax=Dreissena polymorpha TaxID=45954 RepID=A0A9D4L3P9_DREPO|nr:hypothetical protein DPMN_093842 [Dreissena polymorpha]
MSGQYSDTSSKYDPKLIGEAAEVRVFINNIMTNALCDTGSCVSTCSEKFYLENLREIELIPLNNLLKIECADGNELPYKGYVETSLKACGIPGDIEQKCLFLIVPDTEYNKGTPILLGTNILTELIKDCKEIFGEKFLQNSKLHVPWYLAFRCMILREKAIKKNNYTLAIVRSALTHTVSLGPNQSINLKCSTDRELSHYPTCALIQETRQSNLPNFTQITPAIIHYSGKKQEVVVNINNTTQSTVKISPRAVVAELQLVTIDEEKNKMPTDNDTTVLNQINIDQDLNPSQHEELMKILEVHKGIFSTSETDIGSCDIMKHRIELIDKTPFKERYRRIPPSMIEEVRKHLENLLASGVIRRSKSPWASAVVICRKHSGALRMCVDYRKLNARTIKDSYAIPRIDDVLDCLHGSKYFSTLDMKSGYHQIEIEEKHKERTAFTVGPLGFWEFNKLPFGCTNSPATYQRIMEEIIGDLNLKICIIYLDDIIIFSSNYSEHLQRLNLILSRLKAAGIKLSPNKCHFLKKKVKFLGHYVSEEGIETDPEKCDKVKNYPKPNNADQLRSFLALAGYYRKFIKGFSTISKPLTDLLPPTTTKKGKIANKKEWHWDELHERTFTKIKELLTSPPILGFPIFNSPFELHTDACGSGLGAVLYQEQEGKKRVIAYASRSLSKSEKNYSAFKLEFLALKWAITEKFSDYLIGQHFKVYTDNNPLTHILTTAKLEATGQRWVSALSDYDFDIIYRPGKSNTDADIMSRYPEQSNSTEVIKHDTIKAICNTIHTRPFIEVLPCHSLNILDMIDESGQKMAQVEMRELRNQQRNDPIIGVWLRALTDKKFPNKTIIQSNKQHLTMSRHFNNLKIIRGVLYREITENERPIKQLILPSFYRTEVLRGLHDQVGHPGKERTISLVRDRFYWPSYTIDCTKWVEQCQRCLRRKSSNNIKAPLVNIQSSYPLELVCTDFLKVDECKGGIGNVLVITDHFTKYAVAVPTKNQTAKTTAEALLNNFIFHYGVPTRLLSDQGANFESEVIQELCNLMEISKVRTTIYHPQCNGQSERFNRTLISMLATLEPEKKENWKKFVPSLVYAYNAIRHESTGYSPFELMFGRCPRLPVDSMFQIENDDLMNTEYVQDLKQKLEVSWDIALKTLNKSREKQKNNYDKKVKASTINVGDKVLIKILAFSKPHKIADKFEQDVYQVIKQPNLNIPVYVVRKKDGVEKTLHRNHLLLLEEKDMVGNKEEETKSMKPVPRPRKSVKDSVPLNTGKKIDMKEGNSTQRVSTENQREQRYEESSNSESDTEFVRKVSSPAGEKCENRDTSMQPQASSVSTEIEEEAVQEEEEENTEEQEEEETETLEENRDGVDQTHLVTDPGTTEAPRRSNRTRKKPAWFQSYHIGQQQNITKLLEMQIQSTNSNAELLRAMLIH